MMQEVGKGRNKEQEKELESVVVREEATKVQESDGKFTLTTGGLFNEPQFPPPLTQVPLPAMMVDIKEVARLATFFLVCFFWLYSLEYQ
ncbi:hypothetical protein T439DRAFT_323842 [Meredithblackwellia eburnea MCA 4105]